MMLGEKALKRTTARTSTFFLGEPNCPASFMSWMTTRRTEQPSSDY
jgi:hypothetical protein